MILNASSFELVIEEQKISPARSQQRRKIPDFTRQEFNLHFWILLNEVGERRKQNGLVDRREATDANDSRERMIFRHDCVHELVFQKLLGIAIPQNFFAEFGQPNAGRFSEKKGSAEI